MKPPADPAPLDLAAVRARTATAAMVRRWERVALATSVLAAGDVEERMTPAERLALAVLARELGAAMDAVSAARGGAAVIPFRRS